MEKNHIISTSLYSGEKMGHQRQTPEKDDEERRESKLWNDFRNGDKSAYAAIYTSFFPVLLSYGSRICKDKELVQDCIQDLFIELSRCRQNLSATTSVRYYLYRCMRRRIALKVSKSRRERVVLLESDGDDSLSVVILPIEFQKIELETAEERRHEILRALQLLTKKQRKVIQLRFYENMSHKEIAHRMSIHIDTVYNLISKATHSLRSIMRHLPVVLALLIKIFSPPS